MVEPVVSTEVEVASLLVPTLIACAAGVVEVPSLLVAQGGCSRPAVLALSSTVRGLLHHSIQLALFVVRFPNTLLLLMVIAKIRNALILQCLWK